MHCVGRKKNFKMLNLAAISGFRRDVNEICTLMATSSRTMALEDVTNTLSRNVGKGLPLDAV
jgi:hypothetical protein